MCIEAHKALWENGTAKTEELSEKKYDTDLQLWPSFGTTTMHHTCSLSQKRSVA